MKQRPILIVKSADTVRKSAEDGGGEVGARSLVALFGCFKTMVSFLIVNSLLLGTLGKTVVDCG